jgi:hypothetical protein
MVQQHAIQKYAHVLLAASVHQTSPFALAQKELDKVADDLKARKGIILARDLSATLLYDFTHFRELKLPKMCKISVFLLIFVVFRAFFPVFL